MWEPTFCVAIVILYEYLTDVPLYDGGASIGSDSLYQTEEEVY